MQLLKALAAQILGTVAAAGLALLMPVTGLWALIAVQAVSATLFSRLLRQPAWWVPIQLLFAPAALAMLTLQLPSWLYLLAALLLALVFWGTIKGDVPLFLSSPAVSAALQAIVEREAAGSFIDLGAGLGTVAAPLAKARPGMVVEAWERAPIPWLVAAWRCRKLPNTIVYRKSFWHCDLSIYDVVFAFLSPAPMPALGEKALREMRPGTLLVSSTFIIPDWQPEAIISIEDRMTTKLYCYRIK